MNRETLMQKLEEDTAGRRRDTVDNSVSVGIPFHISPGAVTNLAQIRMDFT